MASVSSALAPSSSTVTFNTDQQQEILLRVPPHRLIRVAAVCKEWRLLLADPGFRRLYRELRNLAPMIGYINNGGDDGDIVASFVPTATTNPFRPLVPEEGIDLIALSSRHERVLFQRIREEGSSLLVWDPIAGRHEEVLLPEEFPFTDSNFVATLFCAAPGSIHKSCHGGPFGIVVLGIDSTWTTSAFGYSSASATWTPSPAAPATLAIVEDAEVQFMEGNTLLVGNSLFFLTPCGILRYHFGTMEEHLAYVNVPEDFVCDAMGAVLMPTGNGGIGLAAMYCIDEDRRVHLWEGKVNAAGAADWVDKVEIPVPCNGVWLVGAADGALLITTAEDGPINFDVGTGCFHSLPRPEDNRPVENFVPFVSFYSPEPGQASDGDDPNQEKANSSASTPRMDHGLAEAFLV